MNIVLKTNIEIESLEKNNSQHTFLSFGINNNEYFINVKRIQEILTLGNMTIDSSHPEFIYGVICSRGKTIPVINILQLLFKKSYLKHNPEVVLISETRFGKDNLNIGIAADHIHGLTRSGTEKKIAATDTTYHKGSHIVISSLLGFEELKLLNAICAMTY